jgi:hypothetical protein
MFGRTKGGSTKSPLVRRQSRSRPNLHALESRLDRLQGDLDAVLAGEAPSAPPLTRRALASRWLIVGGLALILAALGLAMF